MVRWFSAEYVYNNIFFGWFLVLVSDASINLFPFVQTTKVGPFTMTVYDEDILNVLYVQGNGLDPFKISWFSTLLKMSPVLQLYLTKEVLHFSPVALLCMRFLQQVFGIDNMKHWVGI